MRYGKSSDRAPFAPNQWDIIAFIIIIALILAFGWGAQQMLIPYEIGQKLNISLDPINLPNYALRTVLRMAIAMLCSILVTFIFGTLAAKNRRAEQIIIPFVDIMQSVPILGFMAISVGPLMALFPGSLLGPECAAIFAIFTSQVWNMVLSFYQSVRTVPQEFREAAHIFRLSAWQRFWRLEVPFAMPGLLWNAMISMSAGWFFVVASEAISVANHNIALPGIGSYIAEAIRLADTSAIWYAIIAMFIVILAYDQLIFRPFISWSEKFKTSLQPDDVESESWVLDLILETKIFRQSKVLIKNCLRLLQNIRLPRRKFDMHLPTRVKTVLSAGASSIWTIALISIIILSLYILANFILREIGYEEMLEVLFLGFVTAVKVFILIIAASLIWVPVGVWLGLRPKWANFFMPVSQFIAAFPMYLIYPLVVMGIIKFNLNVDIWTSPLMILGTQWYILFNVIAGTNAIPKDLRYASKNFGVKRGLWWRKLALPAIFPYYITGAMAAAGGCWNASIVADVVSWGDTTLQAVGLGGYITEYTTKGDFPRIALGISVMCLYVTIFNRLIWHKLYELAEERYAIG